MRWSWIHSGIYFRFIVAMAALAVIPLSLMGIALVNISERGIQDSVLELHTKLAEKLADSLQVYLKSVDDSVRFTINAAQKSSMNWPEKQALLRSLIESHPDIEELSVVDDKARELLKVYNPAITKEPSLLSRAGEAGYVEFHASRRSTFWMEPRPGQPPQLEIYHPLNDALALRVSLQLKSLWRSIGSEQVGGTGFAVVVDHRGRPLLYPPERIPSAMLGSVPRWPVVTQALQAVSIGSGEFSDPSGVLKVGAYAPVSAIRGAVVIQQNKADAYLSARKMKRTALAMIFLVVLLAVYAAVRMARRLTQPLLAMTKAAAQMARGDFPDEVSINTGDELQNLADTFNHMVAQLRKYSELQVDRVLREQQKTEAILFSIVDGILMTDNDGMIQLANRRAREILGVSQEAPIEGRRLEETISLSLLREAVLLRVASPGQGLPSEVDLSTDKSHLFIRVFSQPVTLPGKGTKIGVVTALRDVTLEKQLDKMKEEFLHSITHDLRNPVGSILGFSEFLLKGVVGVLNEQQLDMVGSIQKAASRLLAMVNNILDAAKMEAGKLDVKLKPISLAGVAGHAIDILGALSQRRGLTVKLAAEEEFMVVADGDLMERVFANLIGNAIKFAKEDGCVTVSITENGDCLKACVADDGVGIPQAYLGRIFEKFEQVPGQRQGGTGLGLTICRHIVEAHLGRIWVESEKDHGAQFYFTIPKDLARDDQGKVVRRPEGAVKL